MNAGALLAATALSMLGVGCYRALRHTHPARISATVAITVVASTVAAFAALFAAGWVMWSALTWLRSAPSAPLLLILIPAALLARAAYAAGRARQRAAHAMAVWQGHPR